MRERKKGECKEMLGRVNRKCGRGAVRVKKTEVMQTDSMMWINSHQTDMARINSTLSDVVCEGSMLIQQFHLYWILGADTNANIYSVNNI